MEKKYQSKSVMHERRARPRRKLKLWSKKQSTDKSEQNIKRKTQNGYSTRQDHIENFWRKQKSKMKLKRGKK